MTSLRRPGRLNGVGAWLLALLAAVGLLVFGAGTASAHTQPDAGNRVRACAPETITAVGVSEHIAAGQGRGPPVLQRQIVVATGVAADSAPETFLNRHGQLTNGTYTVDETGMAPHMTGSTTKGKSQFLSGVDADKAVLDAASYADSTSLWVGNKAKVFVENGPIGISGRTGELTNWLNIYRTRTGFVHGAPGGAP